MLTGKEGKGGDEMNLHELIICPNTLSELPPKLILMQQKKIYILQIFIPKLVFPGLINLFIHLGRIYQHAKIKCNFKSEDLLPMTVFQRMYHRL